MDMELKSTLDTMAKTMESQKEEIKKLQGDSTAASEKIAGLEKDLAVATKRLQEKAQRAEMLGMAGASVNDGRKCLGTLFLGMHANSIAAKRYNSFAKGVAGINDSAAKEIGWWGETRELGTALMEKATQFSDDTTGGPFVAHNVMADDWIPLLVPSAKILLELGAKMIDLPAGAGGITTPRQTSDPTVSFTAENGVVQTSDAKWEFITLTPKRAAGGGFVSNRLLFSYQAYLNIFEQRLQYNVMRTIQKYALYGKGAEGQTKGIYYDPKVSKFYLSSTDGTSTGANGKIVAWDDVAYLEEAIALNNGRIDGAGLIMRPEVVRGMKHFRAPQYSGDAVGMPTFAFNTSDTLMSDAKLEEVLGHKYFRLTDVAKGNTVGSGTDCSDIFFGQFDNIDIYTWGGIKVKFSNEATLSGVSAFEQNLSAMLVDTDYDVMIRQPLELIVAPDARTSRA